MEIVVPCAQFIIAVTTCAEPIKGTPCLCGARRGVIVSAGTPVTVLYFVALPSGIHELCITSHVAQGATTIEFNTVKTKRVQGRNIAAVIYIPAAGRAAGLDTATTIEVPENNEGHGHSNMHTRAH